MFVCIILCVLARLKINFVYCACVNFFRWGFFVCFFARGLVCFVGALLLEMMSDGGGILLRRDLVLRRARVDSLEKVRSLNLWGCKLSNVRTYERHGEIGNWR